jgi:hypothetical protein
MYRGKPIPPGFLLITIFLACVAVMPPAGADVIQGDPGLDATLTPPDSFGMPAFCNMVPGGSAEPCDPAAQNVLRGVRISGNFTPGSPDTYGGVPQECMSVCPSMAACPDGYAGFCVESPGEPGSAASSGFAASRQLAYSGSASGGLSQAVTTPDKPVRAAGTQGLQFAGVSATALAFSDAPCAGGATDGFAYPGYRGSGSRASVSSPRAHYSCRF